MSKILFIEDEISLQTTLGGALKEAGFEIENAYDGETGLKTAQTSKPDLILLDLILPKMDGFQVLRDLKSGSGTKDIPVIVLTNLESADDVGKVIALGATTYLVKSNYELGDIVTKIKEVLKK